MHYSLAKVFDSFSTDYFLQLVVTRSTLPASHFLFHSLRILAHVRKCQFHNAHAYFVRALYLQYFHVIRAQTLRAFIEQIIYYETLSQSPSDITIHFANLFFSKLNVKRKLKERNLKFYMFRCFLRCEYLIT